MAVVDAAVMTTEELLALPSDGTQRWLIEGQLREKPMTLRNRIHSAIIANVTFLLMEWCLGQPEPRGQVLCGEAGCRLARNPDTTFGTDVVYISPELAQRQSGESTLIEGVPTLIVEILSPSDKIEEIEEKIDRYQQAEVPLLWVIDPHDRTITIYRPGAVPELVNVRQNLTGMTHLPDFCVPAGRVFG